MKKKFLSIVASALTAAMMVPMFGATALASNDKLDEMREAIIKEQAPMDMKLNGVPLTVHGISTGKTDSVEEYFSASITVAEENNVMIFTYIDQHPDKGTAVIFQYDMAKDCVLNSEINAGYADELGRFDFIAKFDTSYSYSDPKLEIIKTENMSTATNAEDIAVAEIINIIPEAMVYLDSLLTPYGLDFKDLGFETWGNSDIVTKEVPAPVKMDGVEGFTTRLYSVVLQREGDPEGMKYWQDLLKKQKVTGADAAISFLFCPEFEEMNWSDGTFIGILYKLFFNRGYELAEVQYWIDELNLNGKKRIDIVQGFIDSTEWANTCLEYGIVSGGCGVPSITVKPKQPVIDFCTRLYTECLDRDGDAAGIDYWANELANRRKTGTEVGFLFFFCDEFKGFKLGNEEFVNRLYKTFMGREADKAGVEFWVNQIEVQGVSRESVVEQFAGCPEFADICAASGIIAA